MHFVFIPYGIKHCVDHLLQDMTSQKFPLEMKSPDGTATRVLWAQGSVRLLPFGVVEYVFPKESLNNVLTSLDVLNPGNPNGHEGAKGFKQKLLLNFMRKMLECNKIPEYPKGQNLLWIKDHVAILPIGIRDDNMTKMEGGEFKDWTFEAL